ALPILLLLGASMIGIGSAVFHPESSRIARLASGGRHGLAQSLFQVGGNFGQSMGPLLAAFIVVPLGQTSIAWFAVGSLIGIVVLWKVGNWYSRYRATIASRKDSPFVSPFGRSRVMWALIVLTLLVFSKNAYVASISSFYTFYAIET